MNGFEGLGRALAVVTGEGEDDPETRYAEIVGDLARHAFATGETRSAMLEAFAAALNHPQHSRAIETIIWTILEG